MAKFDDLVTEAKEFQKASNRAGACSFIVWSGDQWKQDMCSPTAACHAGLGRTKDERVITTSLWSQKPNLKEAADAFWKWLFDTKASPWRKCFAKGTTPIIFEKGVIFQIQPGVDRRLFHGLCVASRIPWEHPKNLKTWWFFKKEGFGDLEAFFLQNYVHLDDNDNWMRPIYSPGHYPVNAKTMLNLKAMRKGEPCQGTAIPCDKQQGYLGVTNMFNEANSNAPEAQDWFNNGKKTKEKKYDGLFPKSWDRTILANVRDYAVKGTFAKERVKFPT